MSHDRDDEIERLRADLLTADGQNMELSAERDWFKAKFESYEYELHKARELLIKCRREIDEQDKYLEQLVPRADNDPCKGYPHPALRDIDAFLADRETDDD